MEENATNGYRSPDQVHQSKLESTLKITTCSKITDERTSGIYSTLPVTLFLLVWIIWYDFDGSKLVLSRQSSPPVNGTTCSYGTQDQCKILEGKNHESSSEIAICNKLQHERPFPHEFSDSVVYPRTAPLAGDKRPGRHRRTVREQQPPQSLLQHVTILQSTELLFWRALYSRPSRY
jgi:hypothetical protein